LKWTISANDRRREKAHPAPRETPPGASDQNIQIGVVPFFDCYHIQLFVLAAIHDIVWVKIVSALSSDERMHQPHESGFTLWSEDVLLNRPGI
jgi:hypothetical protein